jgi:catalase
VGNNTPVFFIRDGIKFPDFIHSQKYDPFTNRQEPDNVWDFFSHTPEATHHFRRADEELGWRLAVAIAQVRENKAGE